MATVSYGHQFDYGHTEDGERIPLLKFRVSNLNEPSLMLDVEAVPDSGAERSLLDGQIGTALGINVLDGPRLTFETMAGHLFPASLHTVQMSHLTLGTFELEVAFSTGVIRRNVLGRDFFDLVQIGFREHHLMFFVTPMP